MYSIIIITIYAKEVIKRQSLNVGNSFLWIKVQRSDEQLNNNHDNNKICIRNNNNNVATTKIMMTPPNMKYSF